MSYTTGINNIALITCDIKDRWYDIEGDMKDIPKRFALGLNDGPPRVLGDRMKFYDILGDMCEVVLVDDANGYEDQISTWADSKSRPVQFGDRRAAVILQEAA